MGEIFLEVEFGKIDSLNESLNTKVEIDTLIEYLKSGFEEFFNVEFEESNLTPQELKDAILCARRYFWGMARSEEVDFFNFNIKLLKIKLLTI